ncbi:hypothetical protein RFI_40255, partial [Reticulomyxa filosa]
TSRLRKADRERKKSILCSNKHYTVENMTTQTTFSLESTEINRSSSSDTLAFTNVLGKEESKSLFVNEPAYVDFNFFLPFHPTLMDSSTAIQEAIATELQIEKKDVHIRECSQRQTRRIHVKGWISTIEKHRKTIMERFHLALQKQNLSRRITELTKIETPRLAVSQLQLSFTNVDFQNKPELDIPNYQNPTVFSPSAQSSQISRTLSSFSSSSSLLSL